MIVAWRSGSLQGVSRMGTMGLGGLFLHTQNPPADGSSLELIFDISAGAEVRARAVVCNALPGKGMGVKFVHMRAEDRSRLTQFLKAQLEAGHGRGESAAEKGRAKGHEADSKTTSPDSSDMGSAHAAAQSSAGPTTDSSDQAGTAPSSGGTGNGCEEDTSGAADKSTVYEEISEEELQRYLALSEKSNHYQLLGVNADAGRAEIRLGFYALARKFHPDRHMDRSEWSGALQQLMGAITEAYNVLIDETKRGAYDRKLTLSQTRTEAEETIEECAKLAAKCQRDENVAGAIFWMRKCVILAPEVAKYRVALATNLAGAAHHRREAVEHFQKAIELDQWNASAHLQFGELYEAMQLPWRAEALYSKVLEIDPEHAVARQRLARLNAKENKKTTPRIARLFSKKS